MNHNRVKISPEESKILFNYFDRSKEGATRYKDFVTVLRGFMSDYRRSMAEKLYDELLHASSKKAITLDDIRRCFSTNHMGNPDLDVTEHTAVNFVDMLQHHQAIWVNSPYEERRTLSRRRCGYS